MDSWGLGGGGGGAIEQEGEEGKSFLKDFGRLDTSTSYPKPREDKAYFWHELSLFIYSLFNELVGNQSLNFKRKDRKVVWVAVSLVIWLQF